jgi:leader peptidase (prepilin peptidase) / N-methyltransferase
MSTNTAAPAASPTDDENVITPDVDEPWLPVIATPGTASVLAGTAVCAGLLVGWLTPSFGVFTTLSAVLLASALVVLSFVDFKVHRLPDEITLPLYGLLGILNLLAAVTGEIGWGHFWTAAACMAGAYVVFFVLAVLTGIGWGDVKLAGALGLALGVYGVAQAVLGVLLLPVALGGFGAFALILMGRPGKSHMAFGPFMGLGSLIVLVVPAATALFTGAPV